jgi:hypothetical protein
MPRKRKRAGVAWSWRSSARESARARELLLLFLLPLLLLWGEVAGELRTETEPLGCRERS